MQDPNEGLDGRAGAEEGEDGQQSPQAPEAQPSSQSSATEGDYGTFPQSGPQDSSSPAAPGSQAAPGSPSPGSPVGSGAAAEEAAVIPHNEHPPLLPGPSGDTASTTGNRLLELYPSLRDPRQGLLDHRDAKTSMEGLGDTVHS